MVIDTSVLIVLLVEEPDWSALLQTIRNSETPGIISSATYVETRIVILRRGEPDRALVRFENLLPALQVQVVPLDERQARIAAEAYATYGKGRHPAALNFGDCFSYALAKHLDQALLFKGDDFSRTDVLIAGPA